MERRNCRRRESRDGTTMKNSEHRRLGDRAGAEGEQELMEHSWKRRRREDYP